VIEKERRNIKLVYYFKVTEKQLKSSSACVPLSLLYEERERERERGVDKAQKLVPMTTPSLTFASSFTSPTCEIPQFVHLDCSSSVSCANVTFPGL
jgi:hypothetical protein